MIALHDAPAVMAIEEYIEKLNFLGDVELVEVAQGMLSILPVVIDLHNRNHGYTGIPELRILNEELPNAEGITGMIRISHGMVYHCSRVDIPDLEGIINVRNIMKLAGNTQWLRNLMLSWVALHEYMHGIRQHDASLTDLGDDHATQMAIEYDADLCAVASIYRFAQPLRMMGLSDLDVRKVALCSTFWCLRTLTSFCKRTTHSSVAERMVQMMTKLSTLVENPAPGELPDNNVELPETVARTTELSTVLATIEQQFQRGQDYNVDHGNLHQEILQTLSDGSWMTATVRWNQIRMQVAERMGGAPLEAERRNSLTIKNSARIGASYTRS